MKLVPIEPTIEMLVAADRLPGTFSLGDEWRAMIAAAPAGHLHGKAGTALREVAALPWFYDMEDDNVVMVPLSVGAIRSAKAGHVQGEAGGEARETERGLLLSWAVDRWLEQVKNRPLVNVHRRSLDGVWRQVIRYAGGDPDALVGPSHDSLLAANPATQAGPALEAGGRLPRPAGHPDNTMAEDVQAAFGRWGAADAKHADSVAGERLQAEGEPSKYNLEPNSAEADAFDFLRNAKNLLKQQIQRTQFANNLNAENAIGWIEAAERLLSVPTSQ